MRYVDLRAFSDWSYANTNRKKAHKIEPHEQCDDSGPIKCPMFDPITLIFDILFIFISVCPKTKQHKTTNQLSVLCWALKQVNVDLFLFHSVFTRCQTIYVYIELYSPTTWRQWLTVEEVKSWVKSDRFFFLGVGSWEWNFHHFIVGFKVEDILLSNNTISEIHL